VGEADSVLVGTSSVLVGASSLVDDEPSSVELDSVEVGSAGAEEVMVVYTVTVVVAVPAA
jgi:hypothetical protein